MNSEKLLENAAKLAEALKDNPAADSIIGFFYWVTVFIFVYAILVLLVNTIKKSRTDRVLDNVDTSLRDTVFALGKVATALEERED